MRILGRLGGNQGMVARTLQVLKEVPLGRELAGSPFLLRELYDIFSGSEKANYVGAGKSADLYQWMLDRLCERERERQDYDLTNPEQIEFLEEVANWIYSDNPAPNSHGVGLDTGAVQFMVEYVFEDKIQPGQDPERRKAELIEKLTHHAVLNAVGGEIDRVQFIHHTWKDFLVSKRLERSIERAITRREWEEVAQVLLGKPLPEWVSVFLASGMEEGYLKTVVQDAPRLRDPRIFPKILTIALNYAEMQEPKDTERRSEVFLRLLGGYTFKGKLLSLVRFRKLDFSGQSFDGSDVRDGQFIGCNLRGASFRSCHLTNVSFEECDLQEADFSNARANNVSFVDCELKRAALQSCLGLSTPMRQVLADNGALVDMGGVLSRVPLDARESVKDLLRKVLGKFRYDASKIESSLVRGIPLSMRPFVKEKLVRRLVNMGYLDVIDRGTGTPVIYKRKDKKNPEAWRLVDNGEESPEVAALIETLLREFGE